MSGGKLRELRRRVQSIKDIQQTTQAMKLVAAAKLRRAQDAIVKMRPFANALNDMLSHITDAVSQDVQLPWAQSRPINYYVLIHVTSHRGLCGAYNSNLNRRAKQRVEQVLKENSELSRENIEIIAIGKKGLQFFQKEGFKTNDSFFNLIEELTFEKARELSRYLREKFLKGEIDLIDVVYAKFKNAAVQLYEVETFLPIKSVEKEEKSASVEFIFEPEADRLLDELIPWLLDQHIYRVLLDARASEHGARMTAMDKATENASELLKELRIQMNKARQETITRELAELVSGAAAQEGNY
ncbi:MAG: ATP synthase F1 subunit gamma [Chlorobi bacterium]|nr:ATP synthase F1 subunit gamma [Chlorobiota bacterium]